MLDYQMPPDQIPPPPSCNGVDGNPYHSITAQQTQQFITEYHISDPYCNIYKHLLLSTSEFLNGAVCEIDVLFF